MKNIVEKMEVKFKNLLQDRFNEAKQVGENCNYAFHAR